MAPGGAGATQFHGVFSADVSVVTPAVCPLTGRDGQTPASHCDKKILDALHSHFQAAVQKYFSMKTNFKKEAGSLSFNVLSSESDDRKHEETPGVRGQDSVLGMG